MITTVRHQRSYHFNLHIKYIHRSRPPRIAQTYPSTSACSADMIANERKSTQTFPHMRALLAATSAEIPLQSCSCHHALLLRITTLCRILHGAKNDFNKCNAMQNTMQWIHQQTNHASATHHSMSYTALSQCKAMPLKLAIAGRPRQASRA